MYCIEICDIDRLNKCYDKISQKEISWNIAKLRLKKGLSNTFWVVIDSKRIV